MKSTQLLSVVFSLIMFTGVTAGNTAFAESDEIDDILEDYCEMTLDERSDILSKYGLDEYAEKLAIICEIEDEDERENSLEDVIDAINYETLDDVENKVEDETNDETDDDTDDDVDVSRSGKPYHLEDRLENFCNMSDEEKRQFFEDNPRLAQYSERLANYCDLSDYSRDSKLKDFIRNNITDEDRDGVRDYVRADVRDYSDEYSNKGPGNLRDHFAMYCDMTAEERLEKMEAKHDALPDDLRADMARYCEMSENEQDDFRDIMMDRMDELHDSMKDKMMDRPHMDYKKDMREHLDRYCGMTDEDKRAFVAENDKAEDHVEKMNRYCTLDESDRINFLEEHKDEYMKHMKDKMHDKKSNHMDYDRLCAMESSDLALEITDVAKLERISDWCEMTPAEREDYKDEHHDDLKEKMSCECHEGDDGTMNCPMTDGESDMQCSMMDKKHEMKEKHHDKMEKFSDKSDRLKAMIMDKRDISDERHDEIKMKFEEKHGEDSDKKRSEIKMKYKEHVKHMKFKMSDERKSDVHERLAEMKAYKAELGESSDMSEQEKQQLREEFIEKAKDMQLAWISPRTQITAGVDPVDVECREGFNLVMKASNGVAMCLKADTALKMIDRGIVVPAN